MDAQRARRRRRARGRKPATRPQPPPAQPIDAHAIDALYGLEPVYEPGASARDEPTPFVTVECPYCGEPFETRLDLTAGSSHYIEDCQVCCQPIEFRLEVDASGQLLALRLQRGD